jgi:hypothetical protein
MKCKKLKTFFCIFILLFTSINILGQSKRSLRFQKNLLQLKRQNPDGWFNLLVPKIAGKVERHADVSGGFFITNKIEIDYSYWAYEDTPNWLRDVVSKYSKSPELYCPKKSAKTLTWRTKIDGKKVIIQKCVETASWKIQGFIYYVTFPKLKVYDGDKFNYGMFNLTITYKNRRYLPTVEKIVRSLSFGK